MIFPFQVVSCVKLLKSFDAKAINASNDDAECETSLRGGKRGQITEQLADLPIDYQIYEQIENAGVEGIHMMEVSDLSVMLVYFVGMVPVLRFFRTCVETLLASWL